MLVLGLHADTKGHVAMRPKTHRFVETVSDLTVGTVIVLVHVALAERDAKRPRATSPDAASARRRPWRSSLGP